MQPQRRVILGTDEHDVIARATRSNLIFRQFPRFEVEELPLQVIAFALRHAARDLKDGVVLIEDDPYLARITRLILCQRCVARHPELVGVDGVEWPLFSHSLADGLLHRRTSIPRDQKRLTT
jgi:hypothetical protein